MHDLTAAMVSGGECIFISTVRHGRELGKAVAIVVRIVVGCGFATLIDSTVNLLRCDCRGCRVLVGRFTFFDVNGTRSIVYNFSVRTLQIN